MPVITRMKTHRFLGLQSFLLAAWSVGVQAQFVNYPSPAGTLASADYTVEVNGQSVFVYTAKVAIDNSNAAPPTVPVTELASFSYFDCSGPVTVTVTSQIPFTKVTIRPTSFGIVPQTVGNKITFTLPKPRKVSLELNGGWRKPLFLFADSLADFPKEGAPGVRYFGPGVHNPGQIKLTSNQTVVIAGGAVVKGSILAQGANNVKILGRGILDASGYAVHTTDMVKIDQCRNVTIKGLILLDSPHWTVPLYNSDSISISSLKLIGWRQNSDGINAVASRTVRIHDCFIRSWDDLLATKSFGLRGPGDYIATQCVLWGDIAHAIDIGHEFRVPTAGGFLFKDIDIIRNRGGVGESALGIHNADAAMVSDIRFEDIRLEDVHESFIEIRILKTPFSFDVERGHVKGVIFKNVSLANSTDQVSTLDGFDATHLVEDISFENLTMGGQIILSAQAGRIKVGTFTRNIRFHPGEGTGTLNFSPSRKGLRMQGIGPWRFDARGSRLRDRGRPGPWFTEFPMPLP